MKPRTRKTSPKRKSPAPNAAPPSAVDAALLQAMSLRIPTRKDETTPLTAIEIERALISGEHARVLETYFGESEYAELTALAARAARRTRRGGPRVLILPGILGSTLALKKGSGLDTIWIDFWDILRGRMAELALPDTGKTICPVDAHPGTYLKLKLWLRGEGFDVDDHPFDWRLTIPDLGKQLANRIAADPAREVFLVAHSMGGLVARAALTHGIPKLKRLIMLGTPNYGSFAPVMVFRGIYRFLKILALLDFPNSAKDLAGKMSTFPGLTEMMPHKEKFSAVNLYDINAWPTSGPRPLPALLASAPKAQAKLATPPQDKATMIAGVDQKTVTSLSVKGGEFVFEETRNGDGTVPLNFAVLPGLDTFYIAEGHGDLPKNKKVWQAVKEIMSGQNPTQLDRSWSPSRAGGTTITESALDAAQQPSAKRGAEIRSTDLRAFAEEFLGGARPADAVAPVVTAAGESATPFQSLVVGRRRQRRVEIRLAHASLTQAKSRAYVVGLFQDVTPVGASMAIDAAMNGAVTDFSQRRMFSNAVGEIFLLPRGRNDLRADLVLFTGLGSLDRFDAQVIETVAENLARSVVRTDIEEFATILMGANAGVSLEAGITAYIRGFLRGLVDTDRDENFRAITLCEIDQARYDALKWTLYRLSSTKLFDDVEVTLREIDLPPAPAFAPAPIRGLGSGAVPTIYLHVRSERKDGTKWRFSSSVLTSGAKATVIGGDAEVTVTELDGHLQQIEKESFSHGTLPKFGGELAKLVLHPDVIAAIEGSPRQHIAVVHDADASRIPWETLAVGGRALALDGGVSRRYIAANMSVAKWLEQRRVEPALNVLLVVNPTGDLPGAALEGGRIEQLCVGKPRVVLSKLVGTEATRARLLDEFGSGKYDVLHYAGHAFFDPVHPARSGLMCSDATLTGADLAGLAKLPSLVFFNACESARVRTKLKKTPHTTKTLRERIERSVGVAEAFLRGGIANYLGTYWPVGDAAAEKFATVFYNALLAGEAVGHSVQKARAEVDTLKSPDWADYLQYGSFEFTLKRTDA